MSTKPLEEIALGAERKLRHIGFSRDFHNRAVILAALRTAIAQQEQEQCKQIEHAREMLNMEDALAPFLPSSKTNKNRDGSKTCATCGRVVFSDECQPAAQEQLKHEWVKQDGKPRFCRKCGTIEEDGREDLVPCRGAAAQEHPATCICVACEQDRANEPWKQPAAQEQKEGA